MKESDLYIPVRDWLRAEGFTVHVESFDADVIAIRDGKVRVVELKPCLTQGLVFQLTRRAQWADEVFAAVASAPRGRWKHGLRYNGFGLLRVSGGKVRQLIKARPQPWGWHKRRSYRLKKLGARLPAQEFEIAGLPSCPQVKQQRQMNRAAQAMGEQA